MPCPLFAMPAALLAAASAALAPVAIAGAQEPPPALQRFVPTPEQLARADRAPANSARAYKLRIDPQWSPDGTSLWYRNDLPQGRREFIAVDLTTGARGPAFDHERLAAALRQRGLADVDAARLPISRLEISNPGRTLQFDAGGKSWQARLDLYELREIAARTGEGPAEGLRSWAPADAPRASARTGPDTEITFVNRTEGEVELLWIDPAGDRVGYGRVPPGEQRAQHTFAGHLWAVADAEGNLLVVFQADEAPAVAEVTGATPPTEGSGRVRRPGRRRAGRRGSDPATTDNRSPDGNWVASVRDHDVFLRSAAPSESQATPGEIRLSTDGREGNAYERLSWAPDSQTLVARRTQPGDKFEVHLIESSPQGGGRARLRSRPYPLPGDKFPVSELVLFRIADRKQIQPRVDRVDFEMSEPHWLRGGAAFAYEQVDRGHQRYRLVEVDCRSGEARTLIDERSETFIWTVHFDDETPRPVTWLQHSEELIYSSERDGTRRAYLFDSAAGVVKNPITPQGWVVRAIDRVDEEARQICFRASGMHPDQDPYFMHHFRVNFDGSGLVALTAGNGNHQIEFSPDRRF
ncbi:MAG TPA: DPP IV N-terminal domain-containing protein, partial [Lacipirellulaceae bacterium]|nr:DPP IV N-terminal domain-containing protein [Lacipirellulaceae bacterium]